MGLKAILDSLEGVDAAIAALYTQVDGAYRLDIEGGFKTPAEVEGLSSALGKERAASAAAHKKLKEFAGIDPIAAREALQRGEMWEADAAPSVTQGAAGHATADAMTGATPHATPHATGHAAAGAMPPAMLATGKFESALQRRLQPLMAERDTYKALADERGAQLEAFSMDAALRESTIFARVEDPIYRESLMSKVRASLKMVDGKLVGFRADGQQVFDSDGNPATGEGLIAAIVSSIPEVQRYFSGGRATGSGAAAGTGLRPVSAPQSYAACVTDAERVAYLENHHNLKGPH